MEFKYIAILFDPAKRTYHQGGVRQIGESPASQEGSIWAGGSGEEWGGVSDKEWWELESGASF